MVLCHKITAVTVCSCHFNSNQWLTLEYDLLCVACGFFRLSYFEADQDWGRKTISLSKGTTPALQSSEYKECFDVDNGAINTFQIEGLEDFLGTLAISDQGPSSQSAAKALGPPGQILNNAPCFSCTIASEGPQT